VEIPEQEGTQWPPFSTGLGLLVWLSTAVQ